MIESDHSDFEAALVDVPVFPLPQVVLFPRALLPLHIFEPRYRAMLRDALAGSKLIVVALIPEGAALNADGNPTFATIAGVGNILEHQAMPDGRSNIVLHGRVRVRLEELRFDGPYRRAKATIVKERVASVPQADRTALVTAAGAYAGEVRRRDARFSFSVPPNLETGQLADLCAHHLLLSASTRQVVLEESDPAIRTRMVIRELASQHSSLVHESGGVLH